MTEEEVETMRRVLRPLRDGLVTKQAPFDPEATRAILEAISTSEGRSRLAQAMAAPIRQRMNLASAFSVEPLQEPCGSCERTDYDEGHRAGCQECSVRSVLTT